MKLNTWNEILKVVSSKLSYNIDYFHKLDIESMSPEQIDDILKYFQGTSREFQTSKEYKQVYPYLKRIHQRSKSILQDIGEKVMKNENIHYGDRVYYDHVNLWGVEQLEGIVENRKGLPFVRITKGNTIKGNKFVRWHKGWKKEK